MKKQKHKSEMADLVIQIPLVFVHEVHDRKTFQETDGRFLPALRPQAKSNGALTDGGGLIQGDDPDLTHELLSHGTTGAFEAPTVELVG